MSKYFILCIVLLLSLTACEKSALKQLPKATQEGKNTIGCLINGKVYNTYQDPTQNSINCHNDCKFYEGGLEGQNIFSVMCKNNGFGSVSIYIYDTLIQGKSYLLGAVSSQAKAEVTSSQPWDHFYTNEDNIQGQLIITKLSPDIISGSFSFNAKGLYDSTLIIKVTEGRFDCSR